GKRLALWYAPKYHCGSWMAVVAGQDVPQSRFTHRPRDKDQVLHAIAQGVWRGLLRGGGWPLAGQRIFCQLGLSPRLLKPIHVTVVDQRLSSAPAAADQLLNRRLGFWRDKICAGSSDAQVRLLGAAMDGEQRPGS